MATNFPTSLDSFTNPSSSSTLDSPSHAAQHANINDAMEAVQAKLGTGAGTIGEWTSFTPSFTNVTLGASGAVTGRYAVVNDLVFYTAKFDLGGTGSVTSHVVMAPPVGTADASTTYATSHSGWVRPTGSTIYHVMGFSGSGAIYYYIYGTGGIPSTAGAVNATLPATWNSNGLGYFAGWYAKA